MKAARRTKTGSRRAKGPPAAPISHEAVLDAIFANLPAPLVRNGHTPEVVRRNRRTRAQRRLLDALDARGPYPLTDALRADLQRTAERWAQKDFPDTFTEAEDLELRCADERAVLDAADRGDEEGRYQAAAAIHRRQVEKRYGWIEIRGLQLAARVYQDLEIAYVPLQVEDPSEAEPLPAKSGKKNGASTTDVEVMAAMMNMLGGPRIPATRALAKHERLLVVGGPGSGKSTLVAYLATRAARGELAAEVGWDTDLMPFVVPVRSLAAESVTLEGLASVAGVEVWYVEAALRRGDGLLLVDGLDEARAEVAGKVLPALSAILNKFHKSRALVTTRPTEMEFPGFARVELTAMTRDEVGTFIDKWCLAAELSLGKVRAHAEAEAKATALDLKERIRERRAIQKLAQTPLLCSVICVVHRFLGQQIPQRRVILYEAITNVLLYEWDRAKFPEGAAIGELDAPAKRALLSKLARSMHEARVVELPEADVVRCFEEHLPSVRRPANDAKALVSEIRDRSGVLVERVPGSFGFAHLTFQEYLTAMEFVNGRTYEMLIEHYQDEWWHEVIVLAAGFPNADAASLVQWLLDKDDGQVAEGTMLAAQCTETAIELSRATRERVEAAIAALVPPKSIDEGAQLVELGTVVVPILLRHISAPDPATRMHSLVVLVTLGDESSLGAIVRALSDPTVWKESVLGQQREMGSVATWAAGLAAYMLRQSDIAFPAFLNAISRAHPDAIARLRKIESNKMFASVLDQIHALIRRYEETHPKPSSSASRPPKRARSG